MAELKKKWYGYEGIQEEDEDDKMPDVDQLNAWTANYLTNFRIAIEWLPREDERLVTEITFPAPILTMHIPRAKPKLSRAWPACSCIVN